MGLGDDDALLKGFQLQVMVEFVATVVTRCWRGKHFDADYVALAKSLGQEWSEMTWNHNLNRSWDRLGQVLVDRSRR